MANESVKKAIVLRKDLPEVGPTNSYLVRFRVVSEDGNSASDWSSPVEVKDLELQDVLGDIDVSANKKSVSATWGDENTRPNYDVYVRFGDNLAEEAGTDSHWGEWFYHGTSPIHTYKFLVPEKYDGVNDTKAVEVQVQIASTIKQMEGTIINDILKIYRGFSEI